MFLVITAAMRSVFVALIALSLSIGTADARGRTVELAYEIYVGGFHAGHIEVIASIGEEQYRLLAATRSEGVIDYLVGFRSYAQSGGSLGDGWVEPRAHHVNNIWTGDHRFIRLNYAGLHGLADGPELSVVHPPPGQDDRESVPVEARRHTIDPLSAALRAALSAVPLPGRLRRACDDVIPVFDGRRRYTLEFADQGLEEIEGPYFVGTARKCQVNLDRVAGFSSHPFLPRSEDPERGEIWFADIVDDLPPVPVRFKADVGLGNALVHLVGLRSD